MSRNDYLEVLASGSNPLIKTVKTRSPWRNWHPFGKILVSDVSKAFALNPQFGKNARHPRRNR
jgi:hypothetical protein